MHQNGNTTGYILRYAAVRTEPVTLSADSSQRTQIVSGLLAGTVYTIEVAAVNRAGAGPYSSPITTMTPGVCLANVLNTPRNTSVSAVQAPVLSVDSQPDAFTVLLSWTSAGSGVDSYVVAWQRDTSVGCPANHEGNATITNGSTSFTLRGLSGDSSYAVTVSDSNGTDMFVSDTLVIQTTEAGL